MTLPPHIDPERLAALLDGRLNEVDAAVVRAALAAQDEETVSAYADAVAVSAELGEASSDGQSGVIAIDRARGKRRWRAPAFAAAAAAAVISVVVFSPRMDSHSYQPAEYAFAIPPGAGMLESPAWGVVRGEGAGLSDRARAVRAGALLTDLELSTLRSDATKEHALALAALLEGVPGAIAVAAPLREYGRSAGAPMSRSLARDIGQQAMAILPRPLADAGAYLEAARIAAASGDTKFFDLVAPNALSGLDRDPALDASTRAELRRLTDLVAARPRDAAAILQASESLLRALAF